MNYRKGLALIIGFVALVFAGSSAIAMLREGELGVFITFTTLTVAESIGIVMTLEEYVEGD